MSFGRPYIMATDGCIHDGWLVLSDRGSNFDQDYLYHFLGSRAAYQQFDRLAAGSTVRNLNIDLVSGVRVPVPPLDSQRDMARQLEDLSSKLSALNNLIRQKLRELDALKRSLLHRAFSGEPLGSELLAA
jgi:type I restriction enzyme S subunit